MRDTTSWPTKQPLVKLTAAKLIEIGLMREELARADILLAVGNAEPDAAERYWLPSAAGSLPFGAMTATAEQRRARIGETMAERGLGEGHADLVIGEIADLDLGAQLVEA